MRKLFIFIISLIFTLSCSSKKNILYIQNSNDIDVDFAYQEYIIQPDDILKIDIGSDNPELITSINPISVNTGIANNRELLLYNGYRVDKEGYIDFPNFNRFFVKGLTLSQLTLKFKNEIIEKGIVTNPSVDIKILNSEFTILGEVNRPGKYDFIENNLNIFEAIGIAGDLTINGERASVKVIRDYNNKKSINEIDLTDINSIYENYQIFPGDIILINPNTTRVKNAGIIGNSGTLLSLLSFVLSSIIIINN